VIRVREMPRPVRKGSERRGRCPTPNHPIGTYRGVDLNRGMMLAREGWHILHMDHPLRTYTLRYSVNKGKVHSFG
jgi:hypothetical protein